MHILIRAKLSTGHSSYQP